MNEYGKTLKKLLNERKNLIWTYSVFLAQNIEDLGFFSSEADPDVWMRAAIKPDGEEYYEYVLCYVDNIMCLSVKAMEVMKQLQGKFKFKKDLIEVPTNYLGAQVKMRTLKDADIWTISSDAYVKAAVENVERTIKDKRWKKLAARAPTPMTSNYEPELDGSQELNDSIISTIKN